MEHGPSMHDALDAALTELTNRGFNCIVDFHNYHSHDRVFGSPQWHDNLHQFGRRFRVDDRIKWMQVWNELFKNTLYNQNWSWTDALNEYAKGIDTLRASCSCWEVIPMLYPDLGDHAGMRGNNYNLPSSALRPPMYICWHYFVSDHAATSQYDLAGYHIRNLTTLQNRYPSIPLMLDEYSTMGRSEVGNYTFARANNVKMLNWCQTHNIPVVTWYYHRNCQSGDHSGVFDEAIGASNFEPTGYVPPEPSEPPVTPEPPPSPAPPTGIWIETIPAQIFPSQLTRKLWLLREKFIPPTIHAKLHPLI